MDTKKCGAFLKELRREKGLTQQALAEALGVSGRTVSRWETGVNLPDLDLLLELSDFYQIELRALLEGERRPVGQPPQGMPQGEAEQEAAGLPRLPGEDNVGEAWKQDEERRTLQRIADYSAAQEKRLLKNVLCTAAAGAAAWLVSLTVTFRFADGVEGSELLFAGEAAAVLLFAVSLFALPANRAPGGVMTTLAGIFGGITLGNLLLLLVFFGSGSYYNYGLRGAFYALGCLLAGFVLCGAGATVWNCRRQRKGDRRKAGRTGRKI